MTDNEQQHTERELVMAKREAFVKGVHTRTHATDPKEAGTRYNDSRAISEELARAVYPLPKITRPRVVFEKDITQDERGWDQQYRCVDGVLEWRAGFKGAAWKPLVCRWDNMAGMQKPTPERLRAWADLLANPIEEVEDTE